MKLLYLVQDVMHQRHIVIDLCILVLCIAGEHKISNVISLRSDLHGETWKRAREGK